VKGKGGVARTVLPARMSYPPVLLGPILGTFEMVPRTGRHDYHATGYIQQPSSFRPKGVQALHPLVQTVSILAVRPRASLEEQAALAVGELKTSILRLVGMSVGPTALPKSVNRSSIMMSIDIADTEITWIDHK